MKIPLYVAICGIRAYTIDLQEKLPTTHVFGLKSTPKSAGWLLFSSLLFSSLLFAS